MFDIMYKRLHERVSLSETGHCIDHNTRSERRAFTCLLYPGVATVYLILSI